MATSDKSMLQLPIFPIVPSLSLVHFNQPRFVMLLPNMKVFTKGKPFPKTRQSKKYWSKPQVGGTRRRQQKFDQSLKARFFSCTQSSTKPVKLQQ